jgi:hypothetical protein
MGISSESRKSAFNALAASPEETDRHWRSGLHAELDALLDARTAFQAQNNIAPSLMPGFDLQLSAAHLSQTPAGDEARNLLERAIKLAASVLGTSIRSAALQKPANSPSEERLRLLRWLGFLKPIIDTPAPTLLGGAPDAYLTYGKVFMALTALDYGEVQDIFTPANKGNRPANIASLTWARMDALRWKVRLKRLGVRDGEANLAISNAFGTTWDTIRKWRKSCEDVLGKVAVVTCLELAKDVSRYKPSPVRVRLFGKPDPLADLELDGRLYQAELKRAAASGPAKKSLVRRAEK